MNADGTLNRAADKIEQTGEKVADKIADQAESARDRAQKAAATLREDVQPTVDALKERVRDFADNVQGQFKDKSNAACQKAEECRDQLHAFVRKEPSKSVGLAVAAGALLGLLVAGLSRDADTRY